MLKKEFANLMPSKQQILKAEILIRRISIAVYSITPEKVQKLTKLHPLRQNTNALYHQRNFMIRSQILLQFILASYICSIF